MRVIFFLILIVLIPTLGRTQEDSLQKEDALKNYISIGHEFAHFDKDFKPWNTTHLENKLTLQQSVFVTRISFANRFQQNGWSINEEFYQKFKSKDYMMLQAGFSPSLIFSNYYFGGEYFNSFSKVWEHSAGLKHIQFSGTPAIWLVNLSLSKYTGRHLSILKANIGYQNGASLQTLGGSLQHRYYHTDQSYSSIFAGYGFNPSLNLFNAAGVNISQNTTFNCGIKTIQQFSKRWAIEGQLEYLWYDFGAIERQQFNYTLKLLYQW